MDGRTGRRRRSALLNSPKLNNAPTSITDVPLDRTAFRPGHTQEIVRTLVQGGAVYHVTNTLTVGGSGGRVIEKTSYFVRDGPWRLRFGVHQRNLVET